MMHISVVNPIVIPKLGMAKKTTHFWSNWGWQLFFCWPEFASSIRHLLAAASRRAWKHRQMLRVTLLWSTPRTQEISPKRLLNGLAYGIGLWQKTLFGSLVSYKACAKASDLTRAEVAQLQRDWRSCFSTPTAILASSSLSWCHLCFSIIEPSQS